MTAGPPHPTRDELLQRIATLERQVASASLTAAATDAEAARRSAAFLHWPGAALISRVSDGRILDASLEFEQVLGYPRADILGRTTLEIGLWHDTGDRGAVMADLLTHGRGVLSGMHIRHHDGHLLQGLFVGRLVHIEGEPCMVSTLHELGDSELANEALRTGERRLRQIIDLVPHFIFAKDREGRFILVNRAVAEAYGTTVEELTGRTDADFARSEEEVRHFRADDRRVIDSGSPVTIAEEPITDATGATRLLTTTKIPFTFSGTDSPALLGVSVDITGRRRTEAALRESEERHRWLAENMTDVLWTMGLDMRLTYVSPSIAKVHGGTPQEWIGRAPEEFILPAHMPAVLEAMRLELAAAVESPDPTRVVTLEIEQRRTDGSPFWTEVTARLTLDPQGRPTGVIGVTRDITERRRADEERRRLQEQLMQAQKMESVGRLAGGVAHDLNNMLTPILGHGELLRGELADPRLRDRVGEILAAGERCRDLVQRLLAFARKQTFALRSLDVSGVVQDFVPMLRRTLREDIAIDLHLAQGLPRVQADRGQLEQILMNLAVNAQDAMPGGGRLRLATSRVRRTAEWARAYQGVSEGEYVLLEVRDTGGGMDEATLAHLFEPFYTTKEHGTGLGLSTVYGIVAQHRGAIACESAEGSGTSFLVHLPCAPESPAESPRPAEETRPTAALGTVMVVEDEPPVRALAVEVLRRAGWSVLEAGDARSARDTLRRHEGAVDLLLTDVVLPDENGRQLYTSLRAERPGLRVLYMSGYTADVIGHHGVLEPEVDFIQKPFAVKDLVARAAEIMARR